MIQNRAGLGSPPPGDLAHQLGTGELVGVAPHWPTPGASAGGHVHGGLSRMDRREIFLLHRAASGPWGTHYDYVHLVDVHAWIAGDLENLRDKLIDSVLRVVPTQRWVEHADDGGSSIAHLLLHVARHQDLAVTTAIRDHPPLFVEYRASLGLDGTPSSAGLPEREDPELTAVVHLDPLLGYVDAVFAATRSWLDDVGTMALDTIPNTSHRLTANAALSVDEVPWLHRMWADKPVWWLVQWPVIGHGHAHVGEAISIRNRMGLSPF